MNNALQMQSIEKLNVIDNPQQRLEIGWLNVVCSTLAEAPRLMEAIDRVVADNPGRIKRGTLKRKYYSWKKHGVAGLVDQRKLKKLNKINPWVECYQTYCENHNRSNKGAWRAMLTDFWDDKALGGGVGTWQEWWRVEHPDCAMPDHCPDGYIPKCARYENLQRAATKSNPDMACQIIAARRGRKAMQPYLLPVLKTRVGLEPGQVYEFDDVDTDAEVRMPGIGKTARIVMFVGYDISSGMRICGCSRPEYVNKSGKAKDSLKEKEFRWMVADLLTNKGFHKNGCRLVVEHGTAAIRTPVENRIKCIPGFGELIKIERSGILAEAVHAGYFKGNGGGNFRMKAYCEGMHKIEHSERAMLPGQIGQDADHRPESHDAMAKYDRNLMEAAQALTEAQREMIRYNLMEYDEMCRCIELMSDRISDRREHSLEGWDSRKVKMWRMDRTMPWQHWQDLDNLPPDKRAAILAYLSVNPGLTAVLPMTRREAWAAGRDNLLTIPMIDLPMLLDERDSVEITVAKDGTFAFKDKFYYGRDKQIYHATCITRSGFQQRLTPKRSYLFYTTPYHQDGVIVNKDSGDIIGVAPLYNKVQTYDRQAIIEAAGAQNHDLARKLMPVRGRHQQEAEARLQLIGHNADVLSGRKQPPLPDIETTATINDLYAEQPVEEDW